jgi:hypothetical protein
VASQRSRQPGHRPSGELLREVVGSVVPESDCDRYLPYARELYATFRRPPLTDFTRRTKLVVQKWFVRGLSGHCLWQIGERLLGRMFPVQGASQGQN